MRFVVDTDELRAQHGVERQRAGELRTIRDEVRSLRSVPLNMADPGVRNGEPEWRRSNIERWVGEIEAAIERAADEYRTVAEQVDGMQGGSWWGAGAGVHGLAALRGGGLGSVWSGSTGSGSLLGFAVPPPGALTGMLMALGGGLLGGALQGAGVGRGAAGANPFGRLVADARAQARAAARLGDQLRSVLAGGASTLTRATGAALHFAQSGLGRLRTWATSAWNAIWSRADALVRQACAGLALVVQRVARGARGGTPRGVGLDTATSRAGRSGTLHTIGQYIGGFGHALARGWEFYGEWLVPTVGERPTYRSGDAGGRSSLWHLQGDNKLGWEQDCGLASISEVLTDQGHPMTEDQVVRWFADHHPEWVSPGDASGRGGTNYVMRARILSELGLESSFAKGQTVEDLARAVEEGHGVIIGVDAGELWRNPLFLKADGGTNHAVMVTGVERDRLTGDIVGFYLNDTGVKNGKRVYHDVGQLRDAWESHGGLATITKSARPVPAPSASFR